MVLELAGRLSRHDIQGVCGPLTGGAFTALLVARELKIEFFYAEKVADRPSDALLSVGYRLPAALRERVRGKRLAIVDDVISAGSAVRGTFADLVTCDAKIVALGSLIVLGSAIQSFAVDNRLALETLAVAELALWEPTSCPLCESGMPLTVPYGPAA